MHSYQPVSISDSILSFLFFTRARARTTGLDVMELMSTPVGRVRGTRATYVTHVAASGGLTRACIREGMLNRCAAAPARARARLRPSRGYHARACAYVRCCRSADRFTTLVIRIRILGRILSFVVVASGILFAAPSLRHAQNAQRRASAYARETRPGDPKLNIVPS